MLGILCKATGGHRWLTVHTEPTGHSAVRCVKCGTTRVDVNPYARFVSPEMMSAEETGAGLPWPRLDPWEQMTGHGRYPADA